MNKTSCNERDNRWTVRVTEWQTRYGKRNQGRQRTRWRDEIGGFAGITWQADRDEWRLEKDVILQ